MSELRKMIVASESQSVFFFFEVHQHITNVYIVSVEEAFIKMIACFNLRTVNKHLPYIHR